MTTPTQPLTNPLIPKGERTYPNPFDASQPAEWEWRQNPPIRSVAITNNIIGGTANIVDAYVTRTMGRELRANIETPVATLSLTRKQLRLLVGQLTRIDSYFSYYQDLEKRRKDYR